MISQILTYYREKREKARNVLDLGPYLIADGMRVRVRTARRRLSRRAWSDAETRRLKAARRAWS